MLINRGVVARTHRRPRRQMRITIEHPHVDTDFGDDHLGNTLAHTRNDAQQLAGLGERADQLIDTVVQAAMAASR
jgi:hypothetical protein